MVVAIQKGLEGIKSKLAGMGYKVVYYDEYKHPIDAYIYFESSNSAFENITGGNGIQSVSFINHGENRGSGVLMINAANKHFYDVVRMLQSRVYGTRI